MLTNKTLPKKEKVINSIFKEKLYTLISSSLSYITAPNENSYKNKNP